MTETKGTEYHVLRLYGELDGAIGPIEGELDPTELWEIVDTRTEIGAEEAKKRYVAENPADEGRTLVTVPTGNWKPQRPKKRAPIYDLEDA